MFILILWLPDDPFVFMIVITWHMEFQQHLLASIAQLHTSTFIFKLYV